MEPNKERIQLWVDALRSGQFRQLKYKLSNGRSMMCCLGVACEVSGLGGWLSAPPGGWFGDPSADYVVYRIPSKEYRCMADLDYRVPPQEVVDWFGLHDKSPLLDLVEEHHGGYTAGAAELNDSGEYTFEQIADAIERTLLAG